MLLLSTNSPMPDFSKQFCWKQTPPITITAQSYHNNSDDGHWLPVAYMSKQMLPAERNYVIYDKGTSRYHRSPKIMAPLSGRKSTSSRNLVRSQKS